MTAPNTPAPARRRPDIAALRAATLQLVPQSTETAINGDLPQNQLASAIAARHEARIRWDDSTQQWFMKSGHIWKPSRDMAVKQVIRRELDLALERRGYNFAIIPGIEKFMQIDMQVGEWETNRHLLPMANGVLNLQTRTLEPYGEHLFDWQLPYEYAPGATCPTVKRYIITATGGDRSVIRLLVAWMYAVLTGRSDLQKYLELVGAGGTGKSTFLELCTGLVGDENRVVTDLKRLEKSQFETANLKGKRLALITDSSRFGGEVSTLKAITGSDPLPYEKKGIQAAEPFVFRGLVMVAANESIQSSDYTSGLARRKIPVQFEHRVSETEKQRYRGQGGIVEVMKGQMPGLVNWLLSLDEAEALNVIMNPEGEVLKQKIETEISTNPILGWLDERVIQCQEREESYVGDAGSLPALYLYPNYAKWCENQGREPMAVKRFSGLVVDNCQTYGIATSKVKNRNGAYLKHLRLRRADDINTPSLISGGVASTV